MAFTIKLGLLFDTHVRLTERIIFQGPGDAPGFRAVGHEDNSMPIAISRFNAALVDLVIHGGDMINGVTNGTVEQNYAEYVSFIDGANPLSAGLVADILYCFGHWDTPGGESGTSFAAAFAGLSGGVTNIIPAGRDADMWWPDGLAPDVANDSYCAYRFDKNGFMIIVLCNTNINIDMTTPGKNGTKTQEEWFEDQLVIAEAAGKPVIVVTHVPFRTSLAATPAWAVATIAYMETNQTIKPIIIGGHHHAATDVIVENGITYINLRGDCWTPSITGSDRFSHSVLEITSPTYTDQYGERSLITLTGYGHQKGAVIDTALVGQWKLNEPDGTAAAPDAIVDSSGNAYHGTNSEAVISIPSPVGYGVSLDGVGDYIDDTAQPLLAFPCSLSVWYNIVSSQTSTLLGISNAAGTGAGLRVLELFLENGIPRMKTKGAGGIVKTLPVSTLGPMYDEWVLVVGVWTEAAPFDGSNVNRDLYINGVLAGNDTVGGGSAVFPATADTITIGALTSNSTQSSLLTGSLSDARIYSGALSLNDIVGILREGRSGLRGRYNSKLTGRKRSRYA
jgi:hypothetical protein